MLLVLVVGGLWGAGDDVDLVAAAAEVAHLNLINRNTSVFPN